jgi:hypothetical protein
MNQEEYEAWRASKQTKAFFQSLSKERERAKELIASDSIAEADLPKIIEKCCAIQDLIEMSYESYKEIEND